MDLIPLPVGSTIGAFLLALPALISIVNPFGSALIFNNVTHRRPASERHELARRIGLYSAIVLLTSLWLGAYVLSFFGVSLSALRIGGGMVVAARAWQLLMKPEVDEQREASSAAPAQHADDIAFFPLTMPLTTGPGTIAVAIALSSQRPTGPNAPIGFYTGVSLAAASVGLIVWFCYLWSDVVTSALGRSGARVTSRLIAFLLFCVGIQIISTGLIDLSVLIRTARS